MNPMNPKSTTPEQIARENGLNLALQLELNTIFDEMAKQVKDIDRKRFAYAVKRIDEVLDTAQLMKVELSDATMLGVPANVHPSLILLFVAMLTRSLPTATK